MRGSLFRLPEPPRRHPAWTVLSVLLHAATIALVVLLSARPPRPRVEMIQLEPPTGPTGAGREVQMPYAMELGRPSSPGRVAAGGPNGGIKYMIDTGVVRLPFDVSQLKPLPEIRQPAGGRAADSLAGAIGTGRLLGPAYGDGRLWVQTDEAAIGIVGPAESAGEHVARVDSAVRAKLFAFLDTMPPDSFAPPGPPPSWTTEINGKTWGVDSKWIYLGDLKLPTALLALLPFPQGNYPEAQRAAALERMRADILQAAQRAETADQFKHYVEEVRKRQDAERAFERAARGDTVIP